MMPSAEARMVSASQQAADLVARHRTGDPVGDAVRAWGDDTGRPAWHATRQQIVRREMPLLAEALDRLTNGGR